jgi:hypothetical protein
MNPSDSDIEEDNDELMETMTDDGPIVPGFYYRNIT